jgi:hypothetical protein
MLRETLVSDRADLGTLFHRLNNQLGVALANAELLETKATDPLGRSRATEVVSGVLAAMSTAKEIRHLIDGAPDERRR